MKNNLKLPHDRQYLITENTKLIHHVIRKYLNISGNLKTSVIYQDNYQIGLIGLIKAAIKFDDNLGNQFSTYAIPMIFGEIRREYREKNENFHGIKYSRRIIDIKNNYEKLIIEYNNKNIILTEDEIIKILNITKQDYITVKNLYNFLELDNVVNNYDSDAINVAELIKDVNVNIENDYENISLDNIIIEEFENLAKTLSKYKRYTLAIRIYEEYLYTLIYANTKISQQELAKKYNVSQAHVSRMISNMNKKLKLILKEKGIIENE